MESILTSVKKVLGIGEEYEHFDVDIIMHINSTFSVLTQLGVGPKKGFSISDKETTWDEYIEDDLKLNDVKSYMYQKVRLMFDPPTMSALLESLNQQIKELEWRLNVAAEYKETEE